MFLICIQIIGKEIHARKHGKPSLESDTNNLVKSLQQGKVFDNIPGWSYRGFPGFTHFTGVTNIKQGSQLASCRAVFVLFHVVTSTTHGVHMDTTWHPCGNPVVSCRNHIVSTFETLCCPPGNQMVSTLKPHGVHMKTT